MRVLVNALSARRGGSKIFFENLLPRLASCDREIAYDVLYPASPLPEWGSNIQCFDMSPVILSPLKRLWFENIQLFRVLRSGKYGTYFQIDDVVPPIVHLTGVKTMAVFHASIQLVMPSQLGDKWHKVLYWRWLKSLALKFIKVPITVSFCTKGELARGNEEIFRKIQVIYHGVDQVRFSHEQGNHSEAGLRLPEKYILSVSTRNPHKNYYRVVQAYAQLLKEENIAEDLVLIGTPVWQWEEDRLRKVVFENQLEDRVHIFDNVDNADLPNIYKQASLYIYASLFDSFGLTSLEAMSCGTPCVTAKFSALPEICGDAAEYFNPLDIRDIKTAMHRVLLDNRRRQQLIEAGFNHVKRFDWDSAANEYYHLLTRDSIPYWMV